MAQKGREWPEFAGDGMAQVCGEGDGMAQVCGEGDGMALVGGEGDGMAQVCTLMSDTVVHAAKVLVVGEDEDDVGALCGVTCCEGDR